MADLFEKFLKNMGPLGKWASVAEGYKMCDDWGVPEENVSFDDFGG